MITIPPDLRPGDTIGIVCPSGYMASEKADTCIATLQEWGYRVRTGKTLGGPSNNYFSGNDKERLDDLQAMLDDDGIHAILCGRGGYGLGRIIEDIDFSRFVKRPKWLIGFSDVTVLHAHVYANYKIATLHAPMAGAFNDGGSEGVFVRSVRDVLQGKKSKYSVDAHPLNRKGTAVGELVGGNLTLLAHLCGTSSEIKTKGRILFLEDVGEYLYNIDRMLHQLKRNGRLDKLAGLIVGGFSDMKDTERPFGEDVYQIIDEIVKEYDYPVCYQFPVSHEKENYALKCGVGYKLTVGKNQVTLEE